MKITLIILQIFSIIGITLLLFDNRNLKEQNKELMSLSKEAVNLNTKLVHICDSIIQANESLVKFINGGKESDKE